MDWAKARNDATCVIVMVLGRDGKKGVVEELKRKLKASRVVAIASVQGLPTRHYDGIRKKVRGSAEIFLTRKTLIMRAIEEGRPELRELGKHLSGSCAVIFSNDSAFRLAKLLRQSKSRTFAKAGQVAPNDIVVPAGETSLTPGPVLTELKQAKIEAKIQGPKIVIAKDAVVARKGEPIPDAVAKILTKLAIEPMEVGLRMAAAYEDGLVYRADVLDIDEGYWLDAMAQAHRQALNLAVFAEIYNAQTIALLVQKAAREANALDAAIGQKGTGEKVEGGMESGSADSEGGGSGNGASGGGAESAASPESAVSAGSAEPSASAN